MPQTSDFDYHLPKNRIATHPPKSRGDAKLLVIDRSTQTLTHRHYSNLADYFKPGDVLVLNNTQVFPARLITQNSKGQSRELLILEKHTADTNSHIATALHHGKVKVGETLTIHNHQLKIIDKTETGSIVIDSDLPIPDLLDNFGQVPLPPYLNRPATPKDTTRYQTIFAQHWGSAAAPTASLNFTDSLKQTLVDRGVIIKYLTLHVGLGTFLPIRTTNLTNHHMHQEFFQIPTDTTHAICTAKATNHSVTALGTTVTRALEFAADQILTTENREPTAVTGEADIFIYPGYDFKIIDHLLTNFHAPASTVLMLTAAFAGWPLLKQAYQQALKYEYKFLSYGDSTLIL